MSVRASSRSLPPLPGVTEAALFDVDDAVSLRCVSESADSDSELSSDVEVLLWLFSDPLEASAVGVPARPKKRLWNRGAMDAVADAAAADAAAEDAAVDVVLPNRLLGVLYDDEAADDDTVPAIHGKFNCRIKHFFNH